MLEEKLKILRKAQQVFLSEGFYKTTLDEIASQLKISKKTIYKHFSSKEELVREAIITFITDNHKIISRLIETELSSVEKCLLMFNHVSKILVNISTNFLNDIRTYKPELWTQIDEMRTKVLSANLKIIIEQGQAEGFIIETSSEILISAFVTSLRGVVNPDTIIANNLSPANAAESIIKILMNGILTPKGRKKFNKLKTGENK